MSRLSTAMDDSDGRPSTGAGSAQRSGCLSPVPPASDFGPRMVPAAIARDSRSPPMFLSAFWGRCAEEEVLSRRTRYLTGFVGLP